ncbi:MAG: hypothetical protein SOH86_03905 [Erysipelotrichaceae bacterium]|jgi:hypothetical protein
MAGMIIVKDGKEYDCSLRKEDITDHVQVNGQDIPLHSLEKWKFYYELIGRDAKVQMIDAYQRQTNIISALQRKYHPCGMIVYESFQDGSEGKNSDFDALLLTDTKQLFHDASIIQKTEMDV